MPKNIFSLVTLWWILFWIIWWVSRRFKKGSNKIQTHPVADLVNSIVGPLVMVFLCAFSVQGKPAEHWVVLLLVLGAAVVIPSVVYAILIRDPEQRWEIIGTHIVMYLILTMFSLNIFHLISKPVLTTFSLCLFGLSGIRYSQGRWIWNDIPGSLGCIFIGLYLTIGFFPLFLTGIILIFIGLSKRFR